MGKIKKSIHPDDDFHYSKMGLSRDKVELWEDGSHVEGKRGEYEWWYYDSHYPDGLRSNTNPILLLGESQRGVRSRCDSVTFRL